MNEFLILTDFQDGETICIPIESIAYFKRSGEGTYIELDLVGVHGPGLHVREDLLTVSKQYENPPSLENFESDE